MQPMYSMRFKLSMMILLVLSLSIPTGCVNENAHITEIKPTDIAESEYVTIDDDGHLSYRGQG